MVVARGGRGMGSRAGPRREREGALFLLDPRAKANPSDAAGAPCPRKMTSMWFRDDAPSPPSGFAPEIDSAAALSRIAGSIESTPLRALPFAPRGAGFEVLGKMENRQVTGSFKARGALNNVMCLTEEERARGVVASSSGNHGRALAWAAKEAGVAASIVMPEDSYPNKIQACRDEGAEVVLTPTRVAADETAAELAAEGRVWVHPYDRDGTIEGAGTVGVEMARDGGDFDVAVMCCGGGGLSAGSALAMRRAARGSEVVLFGAEPIGAATMCAALEAGEPVHFDEITSAIQGINTPFAGTRNVAIAAEVLDGVFTVSDHGVYAAQRLLVRDAPERKWEGEVVEPAGAAALAAVLHPDFEERARAALERRRGARPEGDLRVLVTISGGNPDPAQLERLRA